MLVTLTSEEMKRRFVIQVCHDGTVTIRRRDEPVFNGAALPAYAVDSRQEAVRIRVLMCQRVPAKHPLLPNDDWYKLNGYGTVDRPTVEVEELPAITEKFRRVHAVLRGVEKGA